MNILLLGKLVFTDLYHRANHHEVPIALQFGNLIEKFQVQTFVNDAAKTYSRMRDRCLILGIFNSLKSTRKMFHVDARRETVNCRVFFPLALVKTTPAGKHQVSERHKLSFPVPKFLWCILER